MSAVDWTQYREPWRSIGPQFKAEVEEIIKYGRVSRREPVPLADGRGHPLSFPKAEPGSIAERLVECRRQAGVSQETIAKSARLPATLISRAEQGHLITAATLERLAEVYRVSLAWLRTGQ